MKLSAPKGIVFLISLILVALAVLCQLDVVNVPFVNDNRFWVAAAGYILLMLGCMFKGL